MLSRATFTSSVVATMCVFNRTRVSAFGPPWYSVTLRSSMPHHTLP